MKNKVITDQIKEEKIEKKKKKMNWCHIVRIQGKGREGYARDSGKKRRNLKI